jgi:hypothetical protein
MRLSFAVIGIVLALCSSAQAKLWTWSYSGAGVSASGEFTTTDTSYAGDYTITGVTGQRNGVAITGLWPAGSAIPGNAGYPVDNLLSLSTPQLTINGFGFSLLDGRYSNPFYADFLTPSQYQEVFSDAFSVISEMQISFSATPAPTPQPGQGFAGLAVLTLGALALSLRRAARS